MTTIDITSLLGTGPAPTHGTTRHAREVEIGWQVHAHQAWLTVNDITPFGSELMLELSDGGAIQPGRGELLWTRNRAERMAALAQLAAEAPHLTATTWLEPMGGAR